VRYECAISNDALQSYGREGSTALVCAPDILLDGEEMDAIIAMNLR